VAGSQTEFHVFGQPNKCTDRVYYVPNAIENGAIFTCFLTECQIAWLVGSYSAGDDRERSTLLRRARCWTGKLKRATRRYGKRRQWTSPVRRHPKASEASREIITYASASERDTLAPAWFTS